MKTVLEQIGATNAGNYTKALSKVSTSATARRAGATIARIMPETYCVCGRYPGSAWARLIDGPSCAAEKCKLV